MSKKQILRLIALYINAPRTFPPGNISVKDAARLMGKDQNFIRAGIEGKWLEIGHCKPKKEGEKNSFYISPKEFWEVTGILYDPIERSIIK